jgi:uncharacterized protein with PIN domain
MVVDTSALLAIYFAEPDSGRFEAAILQAPAAVTLQGRRLLEDGRRQRARRPLISPAA